jgi:hypothetical protein
VGGVLVLAVATWPNADFHAASQTPTH